MFVVYCLLLTGTVAEAVFQGHFYKGYVNLSNLAIYISDISCESKNLKYTIRAISDNPKLDN